MPIHRLFLPVLLYAIFTWASIPTRAQTTAPTTAPANPALRESSKSGWWMQRHQTIVNQVQQSVAGKTEKIDLLYLGDSITQNYEKTSPPNSPRENFFPTWQEFYGDRRPLNLGYSADLTGNLLWRLDHGEIDGLTPKLAILLIGTNNTSAGHTAAQTQEGIQAVVAKLHEKLPATKILLLGILPSDLETPPQKSATDAAVNTALKTTYEHSDVVTFLDIGSIFLKDGKVNWDLYYDPLLPKRNGKTPGPLHPNTQGQRMMAQAIEPTVAKLLGDKNKMEKTNQK